MSGTKKERIFEASKTALIGHGAFLNGRLVTPANKWMED